MGDGSRETGLWQVVGVIDCTESNASRWWLPLLCQATRFQECSPSEAAIVSLSSTTTEMRNHHNQQPYIANEPNEQQPHHPISHRPCSLLDSSSFLSLLSAEPRPVTVAVRWSSSSASAVYTPFILHSSLVMIRSVASRVLRSSTRPSYSPSTLTSSFSRPIFTSRPRYAVCTQSNLQSSKSEEEEGARWLLRQQRVER